MKSLIWRQVNAIRLSRKAAPKTHVCLSRCVSRMNYSSCCKVDPITKIRSATYYCWISCKMVMGLEVVMLIFRDSWIVEEQLSHRKRSWCRSWLQKGVFQIWQSRCRCKNLMIYAGKKVAMVGDGINDAICSGASWKLTETNQGTDGADSGRHFHHVLMHSDL